MHHLCRLIEIVVEVSAELTARQEASLEPVELIEDRAQGNRQAHCDLFSYVFNRPFKLKGEHRNTPDLVVSLAAHHLSTLLLLLDSISERWVDGQENGSELPEPEATVLIRIVPVPQQ